MSLEGIKAREGAYLSFPVSAMTEKIEAVFHPGSGRPSLDKLVHDFLGRQKVSWPALSEAYGDLKEIRQREIDCGGFSVSVQFNPRRMTSSTALVDSESLNRRACFLCPANLPNAQKAVLYRESYLILCNPAPIFPGHFTVVHLSHIPQSIEEHIEDFMDLAEDLAPRFNAFYNGPRCGASAPDHLHFQMIPAGSLPIENDLPRSESGKRLRNMDGVTLGCLEGFGREIWLLEGCDRPAMAAAFRRILSTLAGFLSPGDPPRNEPMLNLLVRFLDGIWRIVIFPRRKHRPDVFYREGEARLVIAPAAVEMGGVIITPREQDFHRLDAGLIRALYEEVSLNRETTERFLKVLSADLFYNRIEEKTR
ncbi:MAG: DUF4922 domain-containing protein [Deltaproteobacteria bacterium]|nr:DUF4922 domain-containing protein [Deltaproteobacteria bacterium]